jgi:hypothetical protein
MLMEFLFILDHAVQEVLSAQTTQNPGEFAMLWNVRLYEQSYFLWVNSTSQKNLCHL